MKQVIHFLLLFAIFEHVAVCEPYNSSSIEAYSIPWPVDCSEVRLNGNTKNGIYTIYPKSRTFNCNSLVVYCDMESDGTGWTVIQRRGDYKNPVNYFSQKWSPYKMGFGSLEKEFWLGNDRIHAITNQAQYRIRFDIRHPNGTFASDQYDIFWIDDESQKYMIHISEYAGNGSDIMHHHNNRKFTTKDQDNSGNRCGKIIPGGWWFNNCLPSNLNGLNTQGRSENQQGIHWGDRFTGWHTSLTYSEIKIQATTV